ncbi:hypothetical protein Bbelb_358400 [Branchiostoma belcheri]|nr:hypothetical protein Bbelb_358400 [Branchiostoma belcheri]
MQNGLIQNDQINASSYNHTGYESWRARLYGDRAWWMALGDTERWLQVDFRSRAPRVVTGIQTQGLWGGWVTSYTVSYSNDSLDWSMYGGGQILTGNTNGRNDTVQHDFTPPLVTRYLRVNVRTWHDQIARLRMELLGCDGIDDCTPEPCANGATCYDELDTYTCACAPGFAGDKCTIGEGLSAVHDCSLDIAVLNHELENRKLRPSARIQAEVSREDGNEHANDGNHRNGGKTLGDHGDDLETATN